VVGIHMGALTVTVKTVVVTAVANVQVTLLGKLLNKPANIINGVMVATLGAMQLMPATVI
jgi:hypothetical protein